MSTPTPAIRFDYLPAGTAAITRTEQGILYLWHPVPTLLVSRVEGRLERQAVNALKEAATLCARQGSRCVYFHDFWEMDDYDPEARTELTKTARAVNETSDGLHIAISSKVAAFGVRAAGLILGNITTYSERAPFDAALRDAIRARVRIMR